jgi:hypothetical protein
MIYNFLIANTFKYVETLRYRVSFINVFENVFISLHTYGLGLVPK